MLTEIMHVCKRASKLVQVCKHDAASHHAQCLPYGIGERRDILGSRVP